METISSRNVLLFLTLTFYLSLSSADWIRYFDTFNPNQRFFYDSKTLIKSDFPRVWTLNNLYTGESYKSLQEADCKNKKVRFLSMYLYPLPFGEGKSTFFKTSPTEWTYPVPDTASDAILEILCTKSK